MKTKITVNGMFTNRRLSDTASIMKAMDFGIEALVFPMSFSFEIEREEGREYTEKLRKYLLENPNWSDDLILSSIKSIDLSYSE